MAAPRGGAALLVVLAGVSAALHVGKLPPAVTALQSSLGISLVQAGFLISLVQLAGMLAGLAAGVAADSLGLRRTMIAGLLTLSVASACGAFAQTPASLLFLRAVEGLGFLLASMPAPGLVRRLVAPARLPVYLGLWGAYMPFGTAVALLSGPWIVAGWGWPVWWWLAAMVSALMALALLIGIPADARSAASDARRVAWLSRVAETLRARGPWLVALAFAVYSGQWLAVVGFLPAIYAQSALSTGWAAAATTAAAAVNMAGNLAAGRLLQRGVPAARVLQAGYATMGIAGILAFAPVWPTPGMAALVGPYLAVLLFSMVGGLVPGTLFSLAVAVAPNERSVSTTVGWMQQWSAAGQFAGPPVVAWVALQSGGWHGSWWVTAPCAIAGLALSLAIGRLQQGRLPPA